MALASGEIILWAAIFGMLVGIIWSLKYIVVIDRRIERIERHIESMLGGRRAAPRKKRRKRRR